MTHSLPLESGLGEEVIQFILFITRSLVQFLRSLLGYVGVFIAMPFVALLTFVAWILQKRANHKLALAIKDLFARLENTEPHVLCDLHLEVMKFREKTELRNDSFFILQQLYITKPLYGQMNLGTRILRDAETRLHKAAYPHLQIELTPNQKVEISQLYSKALLSEWADDNEYDLAMHN